MKASLLDGDRNTQADAWTEPAGEPLDIDKLSSILIVLTLILVLAITDIISKNKMINVSYIWQLHFVTQSKRALNLTEIYYYYYYYI